jgi:hypothetical protein
MTKDINEILSKIFEVIEAYETGKFKDLYEANRVLSCNMVYLSREQVEAHQRHNAAYYNSQEKTNAGKDREADKLIPELYQCRKILDTAKGVSIAINNELKRN